MSNKPDQNKSEMYTEQYKIKLLKGPSFLSVGNNNLQLDTVVAQEELLKKDYTVELELLDSNDDAIIIRKSCRKMFGFNKKTGNFMGE